MSPHPSYSAWDRESASVFRPCLSPKKCTVGAGEAGSLRPSSTGVWLLAGWLGLMMQPLQLEKQGQKDSLRGQL